MNICGKWPFEFNYCSNTFDKYWPQIILAINKVYPFFKDPNNIPESEATRLDIVKIVPEEILNKFFGVESIRDYEPPIYNDPDLKNECGPQMGE